MSAKTKKHTIKECRALLRSCDSMLNTLHVYNLPIDLIKKHYNFERIVVHFALCEPQSLLTDPFVFDRIVSLYNQINSDYLIYC